jgi:hypothetical protein
MSNRQLGTIAAVAVVMLVVTIVLYGSGPEAPKTDFAPGRVLIQGLDPAKVHRIIVKAKDNAVTLVRVGDRFTVEEKDRYPASNEHVNDLFIKAQEIRLAEQVTTNPENHKELGVAEGHEDAATVEFRDQKGERIIGFVKGKSPEGTMGVNIRLLGQDTVYTTEEHFWLNDRPMDFVEKKLVEVKKEHLKSASVRTGDDEYTVRRKPKAEEDGEETPSDELVLEPAPPEGKRAKKTALDDVFGALTYFDMTDVAKKDSVAGIAWDGLYRAEVKGDAAYLVRSGKKDDKYYVEIGADLSRADLTAVRRTLQKGSGTDEEHKENEAMLEAVGAVDIAGKRHAGWVYKVSTYDAEKLRKPYKDLIEDDVPDEIAARHILIAYKGAERADDKIARSKDEAKKLAEKVLAEAKKEGADFAALAKKHSDGPTGEKGGDLGTFKKGKMAAEFDEAAFKLKVGEISGVVETKFGFHVIKRTK